MSGKLQWFRLYHRIVDDEKIRLLAFEDRWHFIAVCCLKADGLLDEPDSQLKERKLAVKLGVQTRELEEIRRRLFEVGLIDENMHPTAWDELQYRSDISTDRVRKFREKTKSKQSKRPRNVSVTAQETEAETEAEGERANALSAKRASRLPDGWQPDEVFAKSEGLSSGEIAREAEKFRDYWRGQPGQRGVKLDWQATWKNWVRKVADDGRKSPKRDWRQEPEYRNVL